MILYYSIFFFFIVYLILFNMYIYNRSDGWKLLLRDAKTPQTGSCDCCFPDVNFPVDEDDDDFPRSGLTVAVYDGLLLGLRLIDSRRTVYDTITSTDTSKTANTFITIGSLFKFNLCLINSDIVGSPPLKHVITTTSTR